MRVPVSERIEGLVKAAATRWPGALAVSDPKRVLTYGELDGHGEQLGRTLRSLGVESGDRVGLCLERSAELVVGALGILKAGGAYVALDPSYPQERLTFLLRDVGARVLVGSSATPTALRSEAAFVEVDLAHPAPRRSGSAPHRRQERAMRRTSSTRPDRPESRRG